MAAAKHDHEEEEIPHDGDDEPTLPPVEVSGIKASEAEVLASPVHKEVSAACLLLWNNAFDEAQRVLEPIRNESPRNALSYALITMVKSTITGTSADKEAAVKVMEKADELASKAIDAKKGVEIINTLTTRLASAAGVAPNTPEWTRLHTNVLFDMKLVLAEAKLHIALLQMGTGSRAKGAWNMRKSWKQYQTVMAELEAAPEGVVDVAVRANGLFGLGLFYFFVSMAPSGVASTLMSWLGFVGDRLTGLNYLKDVYPLHGISSPLAACVVVMNDVFFPRGLGHDEECLHEAQVIITDQLGRLPNSSLFLMMDSQLARKQNDGVRSITDMNRCIESARAAGVGVPNNYLAELANSYMYNLDFTNALAAYQNLLNTPGEFDTRGLCTLGMAGAMSMLGQEAEAIKTMKTVSKVASKKSRFDQLGAAMAARAVDHKSVPLTAFEFLWIRRDLAHMRGDNLTRVLAMLEERAPALPMNDPEVKVKYTLLRGACLLGLSRQEEAIVELTACLALDGQVKAEKYLIPHACYEMAEANYELGRWRECGAAITRGLGYSGYDWEDILQRRLKKAQSQLNEEHPEATAAA